MGDEHDSWLETLGVTGFNPADVGASVVSGAGEALASGARAVGDVAEAQFDVTVAGADAIMGAGAHVGAGALDAVGAHGTAAEVRDGANTMQDAAAFNLGEAGKQLNEAKQEVFGVPPILPPPPPPGTPPMPPIPPNPPPPDDLEPPTDRDPPRSEGSIFSGLGKAVSGVGEAIGSGARAVGDLGEAGLDAATAAGAAFAGGSAHIVGGVLDAFGADETAQTLRDAGNASQADARRYAGDAERNLEKAGAEVGWLPPGYPFPTPPPVPDDPPDIPPDPGPVPVPPGPEPDVEWVNRRAGGDEPPPTERPDPPEGGGPPTERPIPPPPPTERPNPPPGDDPPTERNPIIRVEEEG